jgi:hypothetical protein
MFEVTPVFRTFHLTSVPVLFILSQWLRLESCFLKEEKDP